MNIHTAANPNGEVRGQAVTAVMKLSLSGAGERPAPVYSPASGFGIFTLVGNDLSFNIIYHGLSGPAILAQIHGPAADAGTATRLIDLKDYAVGGFGPSGSIVGSVTLGTHQFSAIADGLAYVNIPTAANPGGEIRGQISIHNDAVPFSADLHGESERPNPVDVPGYGFASVGLSGNRLELHVVYRGLSGPAIAAHIHGPAPASGDSGVLLNLVPLHQGLLGTAGEFSGTIELTEELRLSVLTGVTYIDIHTAKNPNGEIRGQIAPILLDTVLNGANERPNPITTDALGTARVAHLGRNLSFQIDYTGLSGDATLAHFHGPADREGTASPLIDLKGFALGNLGRSGFILGSLQLKPKEQEAITDGLTYLNIHTAANGAGEIRGQIQPVVDLGLRPVDPAGVIDAYTAAINAGDVGAALSFVAEDAVYDRPPPFGLLTGKAAVRGFIQDLVNRKAKIQLLGVRTVAGESVKWHSRITLNSSTNPNESQVLLNDSSSIVRGGLIVQHTAQTVQ